MNALTYAPRPATHDRPLMFSEVRVEPTIVLPVVPSDEHVHPGAIALALGGFGIFLSASWIGWSFGYTSLLLGIVTGLAAMYFGLLLGLGRSAAAFRGDTTRRSFAAFLRGHVQTLEGRVSGRDALTQIAFMPILLGVTMVFFACLWLSVRG